MILEKVKWRNMKSLMLKSGSEILNVQDTNSL